MRVLQADLLELAGNNEFDIIVHGCNCFNKFESGIARMIKNKYPAAYEADRETKEADIDKLGTYSFCEQDGLLIINAYTQYWINYISNDIFNYDAFKRILNTLQVTYPSKRYGFPMIGCGLANGDIDKIISMIYEFSIDIESQGGSVTIARSIIKNN